MYSEIQYTFAGLHACFDLTCFDKTVALEIIDKFGPIFGVNFNSPVITETTLEIIDY